jgi:putative copper export protein
MFGFMLFLHLAGISVWLGSIVTIAILLLVIKKQIDSDVGRSLVKKMIGIFNMLTHPSSFIVLVSGIVMIVKLGSSETGKPFWLNYMEQVGGMVVLLFIIVLSILGRRVMKRIAGANIQLASSGISFYVTGMLVTTLLILSVVFVVAGKY